MIKLLSVLDMLFVLFAVLILGDGAATGKKNMKPRFEKKLNALWKNVRENTSPGYLIADISQFAIDDEGDPLEYEIDQRGKRICIIGTTDGKLRLKVSPDRERESNYEFSVTVSDNYGGGGENRSTSLEVYLYILDMNDNKPTFQHTSYHTTVEENARIGSEVIQVTATDADTGNNQRVLYSMESDDPDVRKFFNLDPATGQVTVKEMLDYESKNSYTLNVVARDNGEPSLSSKAKVVIDVSDSGDKKPTFHFNLSDREVNENTRIGTEIAHVQARDGDRAINNRIAYVIVSGNERGLFRLDKRTGNLTVSGILDREKDSMFKLKIKAFEIRQPESFDTAELKIRVVDLNDNRPVFTKNTYLIQVKEESMFPMTILTDIVKAKDQDATWPFNQFRYWMSPSDYFKVFEESGTIVLKRPLPVSDSQPTASFKVYATERNTKENYTASTDVNVLVTRHKPRVVSAMTLGNSSTQICSSFQVLSLVLATTLVLSLLFVDS